MIHTDGRLSEAVARKVSEIEATTDAEVVVVVSRCSGSYRDLAFAAAAAASLATFVVIAWVPWPVPEPMVIADLALVWIGAAWFGAGSPWMARLAGASRRTRQVREAADAAFHAEAVHATPRRLGLLVYASAWEGALELVPDVGIEARVPGGRWAGVRAKASVADIDGLLRSLDAIGAVLAEHLPATGEAQVELADAPRIRP